MRTQQALTLLSDGVIVPSADKSPERATSTWRGTHSLGRMVSSIYVGGVRMVVGDGIKGNAQGSGTTQQEATPSPSSPPNAGGNEDERQATGEPRVYGERRRPRKRPR